MRNKTVEDKYTPLDKVYMLDINRQLDQDTMKEVHLNIFIAAFVFFKFGLLSTRKNFKIKLALLLMISS